MIRTMPLPDHALTQLEGSRALLFDRFASARLGDRQSRSDGSGTLTSRPVRYRAGLLPNAAGKTRGRSSLQQRRTLRLLVVSVSLVYAILLHWSYVHVETVLCEELSVRPLLLSYEAVGCALAVLPALWLRIAAARPSDVCCWMFYLIVYVPTTFLPWHVCDMEPAQALVLPLVLLALLALLCVSGNMRPLTFRLPDANRRGVECAIFIATLVLIGLVVYLSGGVRLNFDLNQVYERRESSQDVAGAGSILAYAVCFLSGCFAPLSMCLGLLRRSFWFVLAGIAGHLAVFMFVGAKGALFAPFFILAVATCLKYARDLFGLCAVAGCAILVVAGDLQYLSTEHYEISVLLVRRELVVPGYLTTCYWDFFSQHPLALYTDRFLRFFLQPRYDLSTSCLIGETYFFSDTNSANGGVWASAFANTGYAGMLLTTVALGWLLRLLNHLASRGYEDLVLFMAAVFGTVWSSGALETSLLSNGILPAMILLAFLRK